jgi:hypothetical protein
MQAWGKEILPALKSIGRGGDVYLSLLINYLFILFLTLLFMFLVIVVALSLFLIIV